MERKKLVCRDCKRLMRLPTSKGDFNWIDFGRVHWKSDTSPICKDNEM